jgi:hypothetical protein
MVQESTVAEDLRIGSRAEGYQDDTDTHLKDKQDRCELAAEQATREHEQQQQKQQQST